MEELPENPPSTENAKEVVEVANKLSELQNEEETGKAQLEEQQITEKQETEETSTAEVKLEELQITEKTSTAEAKLEEQQITEKQETEETSTAEAKLEELQITEKTSTAEAKLEELQITEKTSTAEAKLEEQQITEKQETEETSTAEAKLEELQITESQETSKAEAEELPQIDEQNQTPSNIKREVEKQMSADLGDEKEQTVLNLATAVPTEECLQKVEDLDETGSTATEVSDASGMFPPPPTPVKNDDVIDKLDERQFSLGFFTRLQEAVTDDTAVVPEQGEDSLYKVTSSKRIKKTGIKFSSMDLADSPSAEVDLEMLKEQHQLNEAREKQELAECRRFSGYDKYATSFVDDIIDESVSTIKQHVKRYQASQIGEGSSARTFEEIFGTFTRWPAIQEFTKDVGENAIDEFMRTWEYTQEWLYCIDFLLEQSDECSDYYLYEAKWSIPSKPYPIPQATSSVYFTIEVSRVKPPYCSVDVTYVFESSRFVHTPGKLQFQEQWLFNIIDAKIRLFKQIKF